MPPYAHPLGGKYIFPYIALAAYKLATESLSISNCIASIYKQLEDILIGSDR
jgi:hypothetical protein